MSQIPEDFELLKSMTQDSQTAPGIYRPGPYWLSTAISSDRAIRKYGIGDFRGGSNTIGKSYAGNTLLDARGTLFHGFRKSAGFILKHVFPFHRIFNYQLSLSQQYFRDSMYYKNKFISESQTINDLLSRYRFPADTTRGGCLDFSGIEPHRRSNHYLGLLDIHDFFAGHIDFSSARSVFEIGGGFGANLHILIENYGNLKKFVYLDIVPNLYVATQYLKSFYGDRIISYDRTRNLSKIGFSPNDDLEVLCVAPYQIERLDVEIDIFQNSNSFVEMPIPVVKNYAEHVERLMIGRNSSIALSSYDGFDLNTTFHPDELPRQFSRTFDKYKFRRLLIPEANHYFYISVS